MMEVFELTKMWYETLSDEEKVLYLPIIEVLADNTSERHAWFQIVLGVCGARFLQAACKIHGSASSQGSEGETP